MNVDKRRKGIAIIWVVIVAFVVIGFVGLSVDTGYSMLVAHQLQNAADAGSMAGCLYVRSSAAQVRQSAIHIAGENSAGGESVLLADNPGNAADGDVVIGVYDSSTKQFTPTLVEPNAVKVVARRTADSPGGALGLLFAPMFGIKTVNIEREAISIIGGSTGAGMIMLNEEDKWTFRLSGDVTLDVRDTTNPEGGGAIQVNSNHIQALKTDGNPILLASEINVVATAVSDPPEFDGDVNTDSPVMPDPLAGYQPPADWGTQQQAPTTPITNGTHVLEPGYYPEGVAITGGSVTLTEGIYVLDGEGLKVTGGDLLADGVMLYVVDTTPTDNKPSGVTLTGNGSIEITGIKSGTYEGLAIWQARGNDNPMDIRGTEAFQGIGGAVYARDAHVDITGTSDSFGILQLICDTAGLSGSGMLHINYDGRFPAPGNDIFLVK